LEKLKLQLSGFFKFHESEEYTSKEILELRGALIFIAVTSITSIVGAAFQIFAGHKAPVVLQTISLYSIAVFLSCMLYIRKKKKKGAGWYPLVIGLIVLMIPISARYSYTVKVDWLYATQCTNINWLMLANLIAFQFLYDKKLYRFLIFFVFANLALFYALAWNHGVPMPFHTYTDGKVNYGVMSSREIYNFLMMIAVTYLSYINISEIEKFDKLTLQQAEIIQKQSDEQVLITQEVRAQFEELEAQYEEIEQLNEDMAATHEEIMIVN